MNSESYKNTAYLAIEGSSLKRPASLYLETGIDILSAADHQALSAATAAAAAAAASSSAKRYKNNNAMDTDEYSSSALRSASSMNSASSLSYSHPSTAGTNSAAASTSFGQQQQHHNVFPNTTSSASSSAISSDQQQLPTPSPSLTTLSRCSTSGGSPPTPLNATMSISSSSLYLENTIGGVVNNNNSKQHQQQFLTAPNSSSSSAANLAATGSSSSSTSIDSSKVNRNAGFSAVSSLFSANAISNNACGQSTSSVSASNSDIMASLAPPSVSAMSMSGSAGNGVGLASAFPAPIGVVKVRWEDEGCLVYQMEVATTTLSRRLDNNMVNGTKLLNLAGLSRGKRDGVLKNERPRVVIKNGSMQLKGVWISLERARVLAEQFYVDVAAAKILCDDPSIYEISEEVAAAHSASIMADQKHLSVSVNLSNHNSSRQQQFSRSAPMVSMDPSSAGGSGNPYLQHSYSLPSPTLPSHRMPVISTTSSSSAPSNNNYYAIEAHHHQQQQQQRHHQQQQHQQLYSNASPYGKSSVFSYSEPIVGGLVGSWGGAYVEDSDSMKLARSAPGSSHHSIQQQQVAAAAAAAAVQAHQQQFGHRKSLSDSSGSNNNIHSFMSNNSDTMPAYNMNQLANGKTVYYPEHVTSGLQELETMQLQFGMTGTYDF